MKIPLPVLFNGIFYILLGIAGIFNCLFGSNLVMTGKLVPLIVGLFSLGVGIGLSLRSLICYRIVKSFLVIAFVLALICVGLDLFVDNGYIGSSANGMFVGVFAFVLLSWFSLSLENTKLFFRKKLPVAIKL